MQRHTRAENEKNDPAGNAVDECGPNAENAVEKSDFEFLRWQRRLRKRVRKMAPKILNGFENKNEPPGRPC
jgi:hypothetical protein